MTKAGPDWTVVLAFPSQGGFKKYLIATFYLRLISIPAYAVRRLMHRILLADARPGAPKHECFKSFRGFVYKE